MNFDAALELLSRQPAAPVDVAELALHLAREEYPQLDVDAYLSELDGMAHEAAAYLRGDLDTRLRGLSRYLFHEMGFRGNVQNYYDARNSYLNDVLERRTGIPITLSVVAMAVGCRAGLRVEGIGLPGHFVAKAVADGREVLFDPFHGGRAISPEECEHLVRRVTGVDFSATPANLEVASPGSIVLRMLTNLKGVYLRDGDFARAVRVIERLRQLAPSDPQQRRDLGASLVHAGEPGRAIDHLTAYLETLPTATDTADVRKLLARARGEVARWN